MQSLKKMHFCLVFSIVYASVLLSNRVGIDLLHNFNVLPVSDIER